MAKSRIEIAKPRVVQSLSERSTSIWRHKELAELFAREREHWKLPKTLSLHQFVEFSLSQTELKRVRLALPHRAETLYVWGDVPMLVVALAAKAKSYLTHYTAMGLHELTAQESKTIYVNVEQREQPSNPASLSQESIDRAFRGQQRRTTNVAEFDGFRFMYLNGKNTGQLGVIDQRLGTGESIRMTDLERTLIDIAVRPAYSGGVVEVARAYRRAVSQLSIDRLADYLERMRYVYPYEQVVGFYLSRAGVDDSRLAPLRRKPMRFDFYLAHGIREREYVPEWRLFIAKGL